MINSKTNPIYSNSKSHSQILERLKKRIHQLEEEKQELRHKNYFWGPDDTKP
jgi:hypothetical protein